MPDPRPGSLSDAQLSAVMQACQPLLPADRGAFLQALAHALRGEPEIGDGAVFRACRELQKQFFRPPTISTPQSPRLSTKVHAEPPPRQRAALIDHATEIRCAPKFAAG